MRIVFDAKRYFHNSRGLGNYSRDVVRLIREYAPNWEVVLMDKSGLSRSFMNIPPCDIYHGLSGELPFTIGRSQARSVVTMHDAIFIRYPELYSPTYRWLFTQKVRFACKAADTIIAISEQTKRDMIEFFHADESKIRVVYQGCSNIFRQPVSAEQIAEVKKKYDLPENYLLDVGAIEPRKNLKNLIQAMAAAKIDLPLVAIGGHSKYADEAAVLAQQSGVTLLLRHGVTFADFPAIYKGAEVLCYPSIFEGFGIPILEAMCVGTPVLTSTGSCFAETGGEAALYANPLDIEEIGAQLNRILTNNHLRQEMVAKGTVQANRFTDEQVAKNLIHVLQEPK
ncbi:MAG: glycosyltransferase family 4 protein [Paludibacteraceae bacterium]|nr:glycosyltransferase family 4 protein [Paludibacteraceae bacterium]